MFRALKAAGLAALCVAAVSGAAWAQDGRKSVVVAPIILDAQVESRLPAGFSSDELRREIEIALEATGLFTVPTRDKHELDQVLKEMVLTHRRSARAIPSEYIISTTVMAAELGVRRRTAPNMRDKDLVTPSGSLALRLTVMDAGNAAVKARMPIDVTYAGRDRLADPIGDGDLGRFDAKTFPGSPSDFVALSETAGRLVAKRVLDQVYPAHVVLRTGDQIWISRGEDAGYAIGQTLRVMKLGPALIDPVSGASLGNADAQIGEAQVVEVRPKVSIARIVTSTEAIAAGAVVREPAPPAGDDGE